MKFTVFIPTYNRGDIVGKAIESVLAQSYSDWELLIVDDGSTDNTEVLIGKYLSDRIRYIKKENGGKHTALNVGFSEAKGEYYVILDSDDQLLPNCLAHMAEYINMYESYPGFAGVMGKCCKANEGGGEVYVVGEPFSPDEKFMSYVDFHYRTKKNFGDCCEAIKTSLLKPYRYPEGAYKFVPERYVFDQIGLDHYLFCTNDLFKLIEYRSDGITCNAKNHLKNNAEGFLIDCINKIEVVFPRAKKIKLRKRFKNWVKYWVLFNAVQKKEYRIAKVSLLGKIAEVAAHFYKL